MNQAERIAALTPEQRELLSRRLLERAQPVSVEPTPQLAEIPSLQESPFDPHQPWPLSDIQEVFWIGGSGLFDLGGSSANIFIEYDVAGIAEELAGRLNLVLARAVARHPMLRTVVSADGMQHVLPEVPPYEIELVNLSLLSDEEIERHLESTRERLLYTRFSGDRWPLFDMVLSQLPGGQVRYQARFDAMVVDGPARAQLIDELVRGVVDEEEERVRRDDPPAPAVTYLDHVRAVRAFRSSATWERCRAIGTRACSPFRPLPVSPCRATSARRRCRGSSSGPSPCSIHPPGQPCASGLPSGASRRAASAQPWSPRSCGRGAKNPPSSWPVDHLLPANPPRDPASHRYLRQPLPARSRGEARTVRRARAAPAGPPECRP